MSKFFQYNHFAGLSASTLCLLGTASCKEILEGVNSSYVLSTLENLNIEIDILEKVLDNIRTTQKWKDIYTTLEPKYHLGTEDSQRKDVIRLYKNMYQAFKARKSGNINLYMQFSEDVRFRVELPEIQNILAEMMSDIDELSEVSDTQYNLQGELVKLSSPALTLLTNIYSNRYALFNLKDLVNKVINQKAKSLSRDSVFGTPMFNLKTLGNNLSNINNRINYPFKCKVDALTGQELADVLKEYEADCNRFLELFNGENNQPTKYGVNLKGASFDKYNVIACIQEYYKTSDKANIMTDNAEAFNLVINKLVAIPNFVSVIEKDAQYLEDIVSLCLKLLEVDVIFYAGLSGFDLSDENAVDLSTQDSYIGLQNILLSAFEELADIGIGGLTFFALEHFLKTVRAVDLSTSQDNFHLDEKTYQGLIDNSQLMLKCIESFEYFM